jgi:phage gp29-like protein
MYGLPLRIGKYPAGASEREKEDLMRALQSIGQDASGIISNTTVIEFAEAMSKAASFDSFEKLANYCDTQNSKAILGHSASVDSTAGKLGSENTADDAIYDIIESDALAFDTAFNDQITIPTIKFQFGAQDRYPKFKTLVVPPIDRKLQLDLMNRFQQPLPKTFYYENVGFPIPVDGDEVVMPVQLNVPPGNLFGTSIPAKQEAILGGKKKA